MRTGALWPHKVKPRINYLLKLIEQNQEIIGLEHACIQ